ncbi:MAG: FHA domain-containing protein [Bdellovibrionota bacterium]
MAKLMIYKNQKELMTLELNQAKDYVAGRSPECDILLDDVVFSRQHFKIFYAQGKWTVQSISKYSQLAINHRESDYFHLKNDDKFSTFSYEFHFVDGTISQTKSAIAIADDKTPYREDIVHLDDKTNDLSQDDKTFVPQMTSQEWSIGVPYILLRKEDGSTQTMRLEGDYWIMGRDEGCDITIDDPKASREHCEIFHKQKQFFILDKNSSNGTLLNYKKIPPAQATPLKSGDQIQVGKFLFIFEIRDPLFAEKLTNLPMEVSYDNIQSMDYADEIDSKPSRKVIKVSKFEQNKKKYMMIGGTAVLLLLMFIISSEETPQNKELSSQGNETPLVKQIDSLSPEQKDLVEKSYNLAKTLYTQGKYELALTEVEKIHTLIPEYKDSKEIAQYSKNAIDTLMEQKDIERSEQEQQKLVTKIEGIVEQCGISYSGHRNTDKLQDCLSPALELDPENAKAAQLLEIASQEDMRKDQIQEQRAYYQGQVAQRKRLFNQAEILKKRGKTLDALTAYSRHIASALPDPERLEEKSKTEVRNLQQKIASDVTKLKAQAESSYNKKDYKEAIAKLEQALRLNPQDGDVKDRYSTYSKELQGLVKNLYGDSVLEENLGNIDSAKEKWKKIRNIDVPHGEYFKKSGIKLKKYGI